MAHSAALISTDDLARRMGAPALRIFDCTTYLRPRTDGQPGYVSESGRAVVAYHSMLIFGVLGVSEQGGTAEVAEPPADAEQPVHDLLETYQNINVRNLLESYHDAQQALDLAMGLFASGYLPLDQRSLAENMSMPGSVQATLKKLNGAAFGPAGPTLVTSAIGRGVTAPCSNFDWAAPSSFAASNSMPVQRALNGSMRHGIRGFLCRSPQPRRSRRSPRRRQSWGGRRRSPTSASTTPSLAAADW